jgi:hypothetical protein
MASFRIRDRKILESVIFPIFDKYPLLTSKQYNYIKFKQAYAIAEQNNISNTVAPHKMNLILDILNSKSPDDYISPV